MACTINVISNLFGNGDWGIGADEAGFKAMTSVSVTERAEKAEGKDSRGCVVAIAYYNKTSEVSLEGIGDNRKSAGDVLSLTSVTVDNGTVYCEESAIEYSNEDWVKTTLKGVAYENIA